MSPRKKKAYYAVVKGRVDEPTIFSSWADVHPRINGCRSNFKGFLTFKEAEAYIIEKGYKSYTTAIKEGAGETTPLQGQKAYYAVANGHNPGITEYYNGAGGAAQDHEGHSGSCHQRFRTRAEAEAFFEDWRENYAYIWQREVKNGLDLGLRPESIKVKTKGILQETESSTMTATCELARTLQQLKL